MKMLQGFSLQPTVIAGFTLKSGVCRMNELDEAKSDALSGREAVAFLYSDENTFCTQCMSDREKSWHDAYLLPYQLSPEIGNSAKCVTGIALAILGMSHNGLGTFLLSMNDSFPHLPSLVLPDRYHGWQCF